MGTFFLLPRKTKRYHYPFPKISQKVLSSLILLLSKFPLLEIDLFASALNTKFEKYSSKDSDLDAVAQDALLQPWKGFTAYAVLQIFSLLEH